MGNSLRGRALGVLAGLSLWLVVTPIPAAHADGSTMQTLINQDRSANSKPALIWSPCLADIALQNAQRIANQAYLSHTNGPTLDLSCGVGSTQAGENIGYLSVGINDGDMNTAYMNSPPHRANILGPYAYVGTAWVVAPNGYGYNAEEFLAATSLADAPPAATGVSPSSGPTCGGTAINITGTNFTGATAVSFGGTAALRFSVNSDSQITAISPATAAGTMDIIVTTPAGTSAPSAADQFTSSTPAVTPPPTIAVITPNAAPVAGGTTVTILGGCLGGPTAVIFGGRTAASLSGKSQNQVTAVTPPSPAGTVDVVVSTSAGSSALNSADRFTFAQGYWLVASDGGIFTYGSTPYYGSTGNLRLNRPVVQMTRVPDDGGYWLVASDGGIFSFGDAQYYGSTGAMRLNQPIVGMASTPDGKGYWLVASDGGIFTFGDAQYYGSTGAIRLNQPIVAMAPTPDGKGYWLVASDGGIFTFGDAQYYGSTGAMRLNRPVVGIAPTPDGKGYWLVATDGGIFTFGDARFYGSTGAIVLNKPVVSMSSTQNGNGYWLAAADGGIFAFGDAAFFGSAGAIRLSQPVVGMASA